MPADTRIMILNLPSPPYQDVFRDSAGGFGTAMKASRRHDYGHSGRSYLNPFLPYAISVVREAGYESAILDGTALSLSSSDLLKRVKEWDPNVLISHLSLPSINGDLRLLRRIKHSLPNALIIGVGTVCKEMPSEVLSKGGVDFVLQDRFPFVYNLINVVRALHGNETIKAVDNISYAKAGKIVNNPTSINPKFDELPFPSYDTLKLANYNEFFTDLTGERIRFIRIVGSTGCPYGCGYCPYPVGFGKYWLPRSPESIVDEIEYLNQCHGIRGFLFRDQSFTMNKKHAQKICDEIMRRNLDIAWFCEARVDEISRPILELMQRAGCERIHYGVETGDRELLKMGKPGVRLEAIRKAFKVTKNIGLWANAHIIFGLPGESKESLKRTHRFILELDPDDVFWNFATPYPGTRLYEVALRNNLILTQDWSKYTSHNVVMRTAYLNASDLCRAKRIMMIRSHMNKLKRFLMQSLCGDIRLKYLKNEIIPACKEIGQELFL